MGIIKSRQGYTRPVNTPRSSGNDAVYQGEQTAEVSPLDVPQRGNVGQTGLRSIYRAWNAQYRGLVPHGIGPTITTQHTVAAPAPNQDLQFGINPVLYDTVIKSTTPDELNDPVTPVPVSIIDVPPSSHQYFRGYQMLLGTTVDRIVVPQLYRSSVQLQNMGIGTVFIAETESKALTGFPLYSTATTPVILATTREIWAVAQTGPATIAVLLTYERRSPV